MKAKRAEDKRPSRHERGYDNAWYALARQHRANNPLCEDCLDHGYTVLASDVHHMVKVSADASLRLDGENLRSLCRACHNARTRRGE